MSFGKDAEMRSDTELGEQAAEWLLRLDDADPDEESEYPDAKVRDQAFYEWLETSPDHLRVFLETIETHRRMQLIDARHALKVAELLRHRAHVIPLHKEKPRHAPSAVGEAQEKRLGSVAQRKPLRGIAAAALVGLLGASGYWWSMERNTYTTTVGEQRSTKLEDGSFIYLNTDSKVDVDFSSSARNVRLLRGEALFVVARDSSRPFTVTAGDATVRAIGTQFNVRMYAQGADVAVVEGTVQVTALNEQAGFPAQKLVAGQEAQVSKGKIAPRSRQAVAEPLAWRERRLVFHDARLSDVAAEFNRYNRTKIRVEGTTAQEILLSGIFDADRPQALMLYAAKSSKFEVEPEGDDWVIRAR